LEASEQKRKMPTPFYLGPSMTYQSQQEKVQTAGFADRASMQIFQRGLTGKPVQYLTQEGHNSTCHQESINMLKYLNRFPLITPLLTCGCDAASGQTTSGSC